MKAEEQLKASLKEIGDLKAALDEHAIVAITDPRGKIIYVNDKFCAISKYSREELLGQDHRIINSGYHPKEFIRHLWKTIGQGKVWKGEIKNRARDGTFYWVDTTIVPFLKENGQPRHYIAIRADITQRKNAEEDRMRLAAIVDSSDDAIIGKTLDGIITSWNRGAENIFGYAACEIVGQSILKLIPPERAGEERDIIARLVCGKSVHHFETVRVRKNGKLINVSVTISPIRDEHGKIVGASKIARDITERTKIEDKIKQLNLELESRVASRTAQLEAANKELEAFSYSISHDLRAPLRAMNGFAQILETEFSGQLSPKAKQTIERIGANAARMGQLIDGLLDFSSLNWMPVTRKKVQLAPIVRAVLDELRPELDGRQVQLHIAALPVCDADPSLLRQVFDNLLSNALKYSRHRDPAVIKLGTRRENGRCIYFVQDNGAGFDMKHAGKLFGVFQRLHRLDQFEGTGVGLAIVQRIIQRHGGRIWADAEVGHGATFSFTLNESTS